MTPDWITGNGPANAKLMIVGEAPGKYEEIQRKPFVGPSGELLTELLEIAGISRSQTYITNVVKVRPPDNELQVLHLINNPETGQGYKVEDFLPLLWNEIEAIRPNVIVACGSLACETLTGKKGIKSWRGSILPCINYNIKTIPTIHPAALFQRFKKNSNPEAMFTWKQKAHIQFDIIKAVEESKFPDFNIPIRNIEIIRDSLKLENFFRTYENHYDKVYCDTEVYKAQLVCIGFAFTPEHACSIPLLDLQSNENHSGIPLHELSEIWGIVADKLADIRLKKSGQNFKADKVYWLETAGFTVNNFYDDGMFKMHTISPELPKSLAFQTSILTNEPFYKYEGKEYNPHKDNLDVLLRYNARDCAVNCECDQALDENLKDFGLTNFFYNFVMRCYPIYEKIEKRGFLINKTKREELSQFYGNLLEKTNSRRLDLLREFGINEDVNFNSPKQVGYLIFGKLRCPQRADTSDQTLTALMNNAVKDKRKKEIIETVLDSRSLKKVKTVYVDAREDYDGRIRYTYNQVGTETGRTSTSIIKKPLRNGKWGVPIQTVPRADEFGGRIREMFIPDPGKILIEFDQAQAEARIVALLAEDYELLELFDILDIHRLTASFIYGLSGPWSGPELMQSAINRHRNVSEEYKENLIDFTFLSQVDDFQRQMGKNTRHGLGYDLGEEGLSIKMKVSLYRAKIAYQKVHEMSPKIKGVFHEGIQQALAENNKVLWTPFGRRREYFEKWGKELFREAYAGIPQSTIGDNTKRCLIGIDDIDWIEILAEMHDGFVAQIPEHRVRECYDIVKPVFEQPIDFSKCTLERPAIVIPVDCKIGENWGKMEKFK